MNTRWLTLREAAQYIRLSYNTAKKVWPGWTQHGVTPHRLGKKLIFDSKQLDKFVQAHRIQ